MVIYSYVSLYFFLALNNESDLFETSDFGFLAMVYCRL